MPQNKILIDTNSYLRLAKQIHPLLFSEFGENRNCLYTDSSIEDEWYAQPRLKRKFPWFEDEEFDSNRSRVLSMSKADRRQVDISFDHIWAYSLEACPGPSKVDARLLAIAHTLSIPIVTDDDPMRTLANEFELHTMCTLELMKLMLDAGHVDLSKVDSIYAYWSYDQDLPKNHRRDYKRLFGKTHLSGVPQAHEHAKRAPSSAVFFCIESLPADNRSLSGFC